jgi:uncharacterized membrane protein YfcA
MAFPLPLPDVPWSVLAAIPAIVLVAYVVLGATGFGSSIVAVPALAHAFPLAFAVPLVTSLDALATATLSVRQWRHAVWAEFARLMPAILVGIALGATALVRLPRGPALMSLGVFVALYGLYALAGPRSLRRAPGWLAVPIGVGGGVFSVLFGTGGPIYMAYLSSRIDDKSALRATSSTIVTVSVWIRVGVFLAAGLLQDAALLTLAALMVPVMAIGLALGNRLHHALSRVGVMRMIAVLLVVNGVSLFVRALDVLRGS